MEWVILVFWIVTLIISWFRIGELEDENLKLKNDIASIKRELNKK
jgi:hypothetical protein